MASIKHIPSHKSCVNLQPSSRLKKLNITPLPCCQHCQFYHGANQVVCGPHPYGPDSETCSDYLPKVSNRKQGQATKNRLSRNRYPDWEFWQAFLVMVLGMLTGVLSSGFIAWWLTTHFSIPTTKTITRHGLVR
ncbi:MAG: hypothetical protein JOZ78_08455 [Chroococcidiopsidaceae cyanobacterium CP_BM_ER_R8_30]|nr:hypothetical protein [Chroococcidiopsidaceae cyanobacterium CP_BM_ER_R8_30]